MKSYFIDTNVLIRYFLKDNKAQYKKSLNFIERVEKEKVIGKFSIIIIAEFVWTIESFYKLKRKIFIPPLISLISLKNIKIIETDKKILINTLKLMVDYKFDFADVYLFVTSEGKNIFSFDKDFKKLIRKN